MRTRTAALTACLLLALTACGIGDEPDADTSTAARTPEEEFLANARAADFDSWKTAAPTDAELAAYPPQWCAGLRTGRGVASLLEDVALYPVGEKWGTDKPDAEELVLLGVKAHCPEFGDRVAEEVRLGGRSRGGG
ncbi:hypothetical protein [Streptomyces lateritius]|uniref:hypothetical protein n=1 Tax=Streptomyces lateritius TaxID=67313 RepID=UPI0016727F51|nr:hypothetical protein [Streptomyces lateritius]GGT73065.1 hypothetical protein GCM10010272_15450 [Streptomyces lateritius]